AGDTMTATHRIVSICRLRPLLFFQSTRHARRRIVCVCPDRARQSRAIAATTLHRFDRLTVALCFPARSNAPAAAGFHARTDRSTPAAERESADTEAQSE